MCYACLYYNCACKAVGKLIKRDISLHNDDSKVDAQIIVLHFDGYHPPDATGIVNYINH